MAAAAEDLLSLEDVMDNKIYPELAGSVDNDMIETAIDFFNSDISIDPVDISTYADTYKSVLLLKNKWTDELQKQYDRIMQYAIRR